MLNHSIFLDNIKKKIGSDKFYYQSYFQSNLLYMLHLTTLSKNEN